MCEYTYIYIYVWCVCVCVCVNVCTHIINTINILCTHIFAGASGSQPRSVTPLFLRSSCWARGLEEVKEVQKQSQTHLSRLATSDSKPIIDLHCWTYHTWIKNSFVTQWCSYVWPLWGLMGPERKPMEHAHGTVQIFSNYVNDLPSAVMDWEMLPANKERHHQHRASYAPII